jgi:putative endonuclease
MFYYVYVLENKNREMYIGYTTNLEKRVSEHNHGRNRSTKSGRPWHIIYCEACLNINDATRREKYLKTNQGSRLLKLRLKSYLLR